MALDESIPCMVPAWVNPSYVENHGGGRDGERNYRAGLSKTAGCLPRVQMVTQGAAWRCLPLSLFFLENGGRAILRSLHWKKCCFSEEVFHWTNSLLLTKDKNFTITWGISGVFRVVRGGDFFFKILSVWSLLFQIFHHLIKSVPSEALSQIVIHVWTWPCNRD